MKNLMVLSIRENEILELLTCGKTSKEIAAQLNVSSHTIDTHRRNILKKTNMKNTTQLLGHLMFSYQSHFQMAS
ncbi:MAG: helix-turn-helix transcriptional regulator [Cyclobacteriaceae bacterium]